MELNTNQLAEIFGVTNNTINTWRRNQTDFPKPVDQHRGQNMYDGYEACKWWFRHEFRKARMAESQSTEDLLDLAQERALLAREQRIERAIKNSILRGETAPVETISTVLSQLGGEIVAILEAIPQRVKRRLPTLTGPEVDLITTEITRCRNVISTLEAKLDDARTDTIDRQGR